MKTCSLGPDGPKIPLIGQGTWEMEHDAEPVAAIRHGLSLGMTHVDTAEMYGGGAAERIVGKAIAGRRDDVFLVSKVLPSNASRHGTLAACERSLKNLGTDHLEMYLLHWPGSHPLEETLEAFEQLVGDGKIGRYGVSNFDADEMREICYLAGDGKIACNQVLYHPGERAIEHALIPTCVELNVPVVAYSPLGNGRLLGPQTPGGKALTDIADKRGVSRHQVALRFVLRNPGVFAIPKASRTAHVEDNAMADSWSLTGDEIRTLEAALPPAPKRRGIPML
jgi:diketogulonate reductase-like aldo/keto reductase